MDHYNYSGPVYNSCTVIVDSMTVFMYVNSIDSIDFIVYMNFSLRSSASIYVCTAYQHTVPVQVAHKVGLCSAYSKFTVGQIDLYKLCFICK